MANLGLQLLEAVKKRAEAEIASAEANLNILLNQSVGIGEHTDIVVEVENYVQIIVDAEDKLNVVSKILSKSSKENLNYSYYPSSNERPIGNGDTKPF